MSNIASYHADIDAARQRIAALTVDRAKLAWASLDPASLEKRVDGIIADAAKGAASTLRYVGVRDAIFSSFEFSRYAQNDVFGALAALIPAELKKGLIASVPAGGMTADEHEKRSSETEAALQASLIDEELAIRRLEAQIGRHEYRRPDADPAILLAPTSELEAAASQKPAARGLLRRAS